MKYIVGVKIYNSFEVEADSEEEAEEKVRELSIESTLRDSDFNITYVDEIKEYKTFIDSNNTIRADCGCTEANVLDDNHNECNKKALEGLKNEEEKTNELKGTILQIKDLEAELEFMHLREPDEYKYISHLENTINKLHKKIDKLNENN